MRVPEPLRCLLAVLLLCTALPAGAHSRSVSYSSWQIDVQGAEVQLRLPLVALNPLGLDPRDPKTPAEIASRVSAGFVLSAGDAACIADGAAARRGEAEILVQARWRCPRKPEFLQSSFLLDRIPSHLHLLQLHDGERRSGPWALGSERQRIDLRPLPAGEAPRFGRYLALGVEHILSGWDHLAFLAIVLLGATTLRQLAWRVTGFTLGHSLTLLLASRGWIRPDSTMVEAFIALTIVCAASERVLAGRCSASLHAGLIAGALGLFGWLSGVLPPALGLAAALISAGTAAARDDARVEGARTALFGLFHGLGFASVLGALNPAAQVPLLPLLGFNLGVEIGQLLFVLALWGLLHWWPSLRRLPLAPLVLALGSFWFVMRVA